MKVDGIVIASKVEQRELVGKDGVKRNAVITSVVIQSDAKDGTVEILNCRTYEPLGADVPKRGDKWISPRNVKKYENYNGTIAEVLF